MATTGFKDYYATLGVSKSAAPDQIKQAFRKLARKHHPDVNPGDKSAEAKFKEINEAYEVLSDSDKRRKYDQYGQYWNRMDSPGAPGAAGFDPNGFDFSQYGSFDDFVNELLGRFGGNPPGSQSYAYRGSPGAAGGSNGTGFGGFSDSGYRDPAAGAGQDLESAISLTLAEAFNGVQRRLSLGNETLTVRIPAGVKSGSRIRVKEKGQINPASRRRGDLYLVVEIKPHSFFKFEGDNLICELPITPDEAVLGAAVEVPTPDGSVTMNLPASLRSGQTLRLRGKGWRNPSGERGDQMVRVLIVPPATLSDRERQLYEQLREARSIDPRSHLKQVQL